MRIRRTAVGVLVAVLGTALIDRGLALAQGGAEAADGFTVPMTSWGDPDLTGIWSPGYTLTPLERPDGFQGREFLTGEEVAALESAQAASDGRNYRPDAGTIADVEGAYNDAFTGRGKEVIRTRRTSLIVDPPNGKLPPRTAAAIERLGPYVAPSPNAEGVVGVPYRVDPQRGNYADNPEDRPPSDRCRGVTLPFIRGSSGTYSRIVQTPGSVTIYHEDGHFGGAYRTVYLDGRPHLPAHLRQWLGHSIGHWEGDTLVVDTTNFTDRTSFHGSGKDLHLIERFTRTAPDLVMYEVTIEDPTVWEQSWRVEVPLTLVDNRRNQIFEAACHEGNYAMATILAGARAQDARGRRRAEEHR